MERIVLEVVRDAKRKRKRKRRKKKKAEGERKKRREKWGKTAWMGSDTGGALNT